MRQAGGRVTGGRDALAGRHLAAPPLGERIVTALGEPLVVVRRSALRDILAGALAPGTIETGSAATATVDLARRPSGSR